MRAYDHLYVQDPHKVAVIENLDAFVIRVLLYFIVAAAVYVNARKVARLFADPIDQDAPPAMGPAN
ncbi:MAG: hypothetical protein ACREFX_09875 [Opitutaceae bacterium]